MNIKRRVLFFVLMLVTVTLLMSSFVYAKPRISKKKASLSVGQSVSLELFGSEGGVVKWKSSRNKVASVDNNGVVLAKKGGKATITATYNKKKYKCKITVKKEKITKKSKSKKKKYSSKSYNLTKAKASVQIVGVTPKGLPCNLMGYWVKNGYDKPLDIAVHTYDGGYGMWIKGVNPGETAFVCWASGLSTPMETPYVIKVEAPRGLVGLSDNLILGTPYISGDFLRVPVKNTSGYTMIFTLDAIYYNGDNIVFFDDSTITGLKAGVTGVSKGVLPPYSSGEVAMELPNNTKWLNGVADRSDKISYTHYKIEKRAFGK